MLAIIVTYFNTHHCSLMKKNLSCFLSRMTVPINVVELSFDGMFVVNDSIQFLGGVDNIMWQKERLINLAVERLPDSIDKVAWIDSDIEFLDPDWFDKTERELDSCDVVQLWNECNWLDRFGETQYVMDSVADKGPGNHPGFAWAMRREYFPLPDRYIVGGADSALAANWSKANEEWIDKRFVNHTSAWREYQGKEKRRFADLKMSGLNVEINHHWHLSMSKRRYDFRIEGLARFRFDPFLHLESDQNGLWKWSDKAPRGIRNFLNNYLMSRASKIMI